MTMAVTGVEERGVTQGLVLKIVDSLGTDGEVTLPIEQEKALYLLLWKRSKERKAKP